MIVGSIVAMDPEKGPTQGIVSVYRRQVHGHWPRIRAVVRRADGILPLRNWSCWITRLLRLNALHCWIVQTLPISGVATVGGVIDVSVVIDVHQLPCRLTVNPAQPEPIDVHQGIRIRVDIR